MAQSLQDFFVSLVFKTDGAKQALSTVESIKKKVTGLTAASFALNEMTNALNRVLAPLRVFGEMVHQTGEQADALGDLSERTGVATGTLERLGFIAKLSGTSLETVTTGLRVLNKSIGEASLGGKTQIETFKRLGISIRGANGQLKDGKQMLPELAAAFRGMTSYAQKAAFSMELFGRSGLELLPMLARAPESIHALQEELGQIGGVTSKKFIQAGSDYADNVERLASVWKGIREALSGPVIDLVNRIADAFLKWWKTNGELIRQQFGKWIQQVIDSMGALLNLVWQLRAPLMALAAYFLAIGIAASWPVIAMALIGTALFLLLEDFAQFVAGNDSMIGRLIGRWEQYVQSMEASSPRFGSVLRNITNAVKWFAEQTGSVLNVVLGMFQALFGMHPNDDFRRFLNSVLQMVLGIARGLGYIFAFATGSEKKFGAQMDAISKNLDHWARPDAKEGVPDFLSNGLTHTSPLLVTDEERAQEGFFDRLRKQPLFGKRPAARVAGALSQPSNIESRNVSKTTNVHTNAKIDVHAAPGMDERKLASEVRKQIGQVIDSEMSNGYDQLVPEEY